MPEFLHLTNGSAVIPMIRDAGIGGRIVPWDDVLHEGPVPAGLGPAAMRDRRAEFIASCGWGGRDVVTRDLEARDNALETAIGGTKEINPQLSKPNAQIQEDSGAHIDEIVLWFEHDLYDQLHLLQILDRIPLEGAPRLTAVPDSEYLGLLPAARFQGLFAARRDVTSAELLAARDGWDVFRSPDPRAIVDALPRLTGLRHLGPALRRHLQQFPSIENGLSRTERQTLEVVASGVSALRQVFLGAHVDREEPFFMGDAGFLAHIAGLADTSRPLLRASRQSRQLSLDDELTLTDDGRRILEGELDRVRTCGIDRWLGGVRLLGNGPVWRWEEERQSMRLL